MIFNKFNLFFDPVSWPGEVMITLKLNSFNALIILKKFF